MAAFATAADLEARWRPLTAEEAARADVLLEDAAALIRSALKGFPEPDPDALKVASVAMVKRAMVAGDREGMSQASQTAGPYSASWSYANPDGALYLGSAERQLLGLSRWFVGSMQARSRWSEC